MTADILIIGAGSAGLACGKRLAACGVPFRILEAADAVGGRLRTDLVDGYRLDRGFQFTLTAYPEFRRVLDLDALDLKPFSRAVLVRFGGKFHRLADPRCEPFAALNSLASPIGMLRDKLRLIRLFWEIDRGKLEQQLAKDERPTLDLLRWNGGFSPAMIDRFFRPLAGVLFHERELATSSRLFRFLFRMLAEGQVVVPALGMQAIPDQIAAQLPPNAIRLGTKVERIGHRELALADGEVVRTRAVVVAIDGPTAASLLGADVPDSGSRGIATLYFAADRPPLAEPILLFDGDGHGPINHLAVMSNVSPAYAPAGKALIAAGTVGIPPFDDAELERRSRLQLAEWFGADVSAWRLMRIYRIAHAGPDRTAGALDPWQRPVRIRPGLYVCGDHRDNGALDGALASGFRAAQAAMDDLHATRT